jgi:hypothetical protein
MSEFIQYRNDILVGLNIDREIFFQFPIRLVPCFKSQIYGLSRTDFARERIINNKFIIYIRKVCQQMYNFAKKYLRRKF